MAELKVAWRGPGPDLSSSKRMKLQYVTGDGFHRAQLEPILN